MTTRAKRRGHDDGIAAYVLVGGPDYGTAPRESDVRDDQGVPLQPRSRQAFFWMAVERKWPSQRGDRQPGMSMATALSERGDA